MNHNQNFYRDCQDAYRVALAKTARAENAAMHKHSGVTKWLCPSQSATAKAASDKGSRIRRDVGRELRDRIMGLIETPMSCDGISAVMGKTTGSVAHHLHTLRDQGLARIVGRGEQQRRLWGRV